MKPTRGKTPKKTPRKPQNKDPVEVYCRLRPVSAGETNLCVDVISSNTIKLTPPENSIAVKNGNYKETQHSFKFVFPEQLSQKALFDHVALPLVDDLLHGKNALLFMYGITGSGKTYTMQGTPGDGGILPRCLDVLFNSLGELQARKYVFRPDRSNGMDVQTEADAMMERQRRELLAPPPTPKSTPKTPRRRPPQEDPANFIRVPDTNRIGTVDEDNNYAVFVSYIEIYNNYIYDLLEEQPGDFHNQKPWQTPGSRDDLHAIPLQSKTLREDLNHNMYVANCTEVEAKNTEDAYAVFIKGQRRRKVAHTQLNTESSRSHSVFNIRLVQAPLDPVGEEVLQDKNQVCISQLALVDLAGSERTGRTQNSGDRLREAGNINASLMTLRTCIEVLRENQVNSSSKIVPYRDSKVTHLFKNYFDGEGKVRMVVCVNPQAADYDETTHVMRFAEVTQEVTVARPTAIKFDIGLTPGRRRANQMYKKMIEDGDVENLPMHTPVIINLGPAFPCLEVSDPNEDTIMQNLISFLAEREKKRHTLQEELTRKQGVFRAKLMDMEREMETLKQHNNDLQMKLSSKDKNTLRFEKKIRNLEQEKGMLQKTQTAYEYSKRELESELHTEKERIRKEQQEKDKLRQALKGVAGSEKLKWEKECEKRVKATQMEMQTKIWVKDEKLRQLKQIVCARQEREDNAKKVKADLNRTRSPPARMTQPPVKLRHRRSRSTSNAWVDHKPASTIDTETVLQPAGLKKKRTVAMPTVKDLKGTENYMLTHQEEDSKGEVETKLYKAEVLQTRGGGRSVQFTDIEKLKIERQRSTSPMDRKRPAEEELDSGDWTDVETRCAVGYEGRPGNADPAAGHIVPSKKAKK
ncbi:kinesin-like protein KIF23 isoform X1 [Asterias rubens]|uniref:kinesin-like protein KIF23 isoform X1 n=1 Tax=Asterias rubens TaxID=7604 RepID=UPI00145542A4|nr:kinesin-like protein KIF23 isoform X1 [Asterias rubens]